MDGTLGPRAEKAEALAREVERQIQEADAQAQGEDASRQASLAGYRDSAAVASWAREALRWAVGEGILQGTQANTLDPEGTATRAQLAVMADRFLTLRPAA